MSLVGNFAFQNYDKTAAQAGAGQSGGAFRPHDDVPEQVAQTSSASDSDNLNESERTEQNSLERTPTHDEIEEKRRGDEVANLARRMTSQSHASTYEKDPFQVEHDSILDPHSANFQPRAWAKTLLNLTAKEPEVWKPRTAGFAFKDLNVYGFGSATDYQKTVANVALEVFGMAKKLLGMGKGRKIEILQHLDGVVHAGEMLVVLGPPGSGCSTFLKTISGETHGFFIDKSSHVNYQGIAPAQMHKNFRGECIYTAEVDVHFPMLTVGQTLEFAAYARAPRHIPGHLNATTYAQYLRDVIMAVFGISHTLNTNVGNDFVRGVSGGERKRVTIAEAALSGAPLQCWDNSTRGLDSANAIEFCKTLRMSTDLVGSTSAVAIYQAPQSAYDIFDKVLVLYEGRQIYFGRCGDAKSFFQGMGFVCPDRQTTADFLTSMTSPAERIVRQGHESRVPRSPDEFAAVWQKSPERARLIEEIDEYNRVNVIGGEGYESFKASRRAQQAKQQRVSSPYTLSYSGQIALCLRRGFWRLRADPSLTFVQLFFNIVMALVLGSVFYNLQQDTSSFFSRSALLFFAILLNAFGSALEILTLYAQRPIVEKHSRYAFYHPSCEAIASMLTDLPYKVANAFTFNLTLYFMTNLRREPGAFFFFVLFSFFLTLTMSMVFRTIASVSRTLSQAMAPAAILILAIVIYTGFALPVPYMRGWARWINYLDPVAYGFESLMINEFADREFSCSAFVPQGPSYLNIPATSSICTSVGSVAGQNYVQGTDYIESSYQYYPIHKWRNLGIIIAFMVGLCACYLIATEYISAKKSKGEVLLFRRGHAPAALTKKSSNDLEQVASGHIPAAEKGHDVSAVIKRQTAIFHWEDVCYDIKIKKEERRILDHVDGWVKPGTLTALMGVSGAGKTTLLDVLATRTTMGVISGSMFVDGRERDTSFQRKTGYVQQQDLHLSTSTVREALNFSALLRQPGNVPKKEKLEYVEEVIKLLEMDEYADAVVGVPGEGLNVEQRKRLTIGVELAAKPELLLFLDEPTSGLDSQTSWAICDLMEKLTKNGQAVLCTIHQPSAVLFQRFDRLLFLARGGRTVYFGEVGKGSSVLTQYFERNGAHPCPKDANPAEWMLEVIGAAPGTKTDIDWHATWRGSQEYQEVHRELDRLKAELPHTTAPSASPEDKLSYREFAAPFAVQQWEVTKRVFEQYWRTPSYIYSKMALCVFSGLFIGFSFFNSGTSQQELQNQMFAIFMLFTIFGQLVQQIMPHFVTQRSLYEARERPSKAYSWKAFMIANIAVELPWNALMGVLIFFCWYYPIGLYKNAIPDGQVAARGGLMFLLVLQFMLFVSTFTNMVIAAIPTAETGGNVANLMFTLTLIFCGVLASPSVFPRFWIFMYRVSPFTYLVAAMLAVGVANNEVVCASNEYLNFQPPSGQTCMQYMSAYINGVPAQGFPGAGGYLADPSSTTACQFCALSSTNTFLAQVGISYGDRWRNFGILWVFVFFNVFMAVFLYWLARVPKKSKTTKTSPKAAQTTTGPGTLSGAAEGTKESGATMQ